MRQKSFRKGVVECDINANGAMLNYPANKVGSIIKEHLISQLSAKLQTELKPIEFDFEYSSIKTINDFFLGVINNIENYDIYDVVTVAVKKVDEKKEQENSLTDESESVDEAFTGEVRNAILRGSQILTSKTYGSLNADNFYIYKIT